MSALRRDCRQTSAKVNFMAKPIPSKFLQKRRVKKKVPKKKSAGISKRRPHENSWMVIGTDQSASSIAMAAIGYDGVLRTLKGPEFILLRWSKDDHYFERLKEANKAFDMVHELQGMLGLMVECNQVWIAQEEPFPPGVLTMKGGAKSAPAQALKQQTEISGAFLSGLFRYGFENLWQISHFHWRGMVAEDLDALNEGLMSIHHTKWNNPTILPLPEDWKVNPRNTGKFRAMQWAYNPGYAWQGIYPKEIPWFSPIINSNKEGKIPRPESSKAQAIQSDDRYEALAIMEFLHRDLVEQDAIK